MKNPIPTPTPPSWLEEWAVKEEARRLACWRTPEDDQPILFDLGPICWPVHSEKSKEAP